MLDTQVRWLPVEQIAPNPHQPRREFAPGPLAELAESIRRHGIIQPLTVRHSADGWELIAGERRLRAAKLAGLQTVPCLEMQVDEQDSAILALIENIQRRDLHYLEEAAAIAAAADGLITHPENDDIDWTPDEFVSDWNDLHRGEEPLK